MLLSVYSTYLFDECGNMVSSKSHIYAMEGGDKESKGVKRKGERRVVTFNSVDNSPNARSAHSLCADDGRLFLFGGYAGPLGQRLNDLFVFDISEYILRHSIEENVYMPQQKNRNGKK